MVCQADGYRRQAVPTGSPGELASFESRIYWVFIQRRLRFMMTKRVELSCLLAKISVGSSSSRSLSSLFSTGSCPLF